LRQSRVEQTAAKETHAWRAAASRCTRRSGTPSARPTPTGSGKGPREEHSSAAALRAAACGRSRWNGRRQTRPADRSGDRARTSHARQWQQRARAR
jgi:hypothetical protein